jgi:hypothetical protein
MFATKCPGQDMRYWTAEDVHEQKCPQCGEMVEFFKTDIRLRCPDCKTRVANTKFDMGCAQWCAYAEQCLGPAARGLKGKSLRTLFEEELEKRIEDLPETLVTAKKAIKEAEQRCREEEVDMLPVIAAIVIITLQNNERLGDSGELFETIEREQALPQQAVKETTEVLKNITEGNYDGIMEKILATSMASGEPANQ